MGLPPSFPSSLLCRTLRKSTSNASPNECAGSVLTINTFKSLYCGEDANSTANADEMDVLPTPPFPPTNITGVSLDVGSEDLVAVFAISSINGCNEYNLVVVDDGNDLECTTVLDDGKDLVNFDTGVYCVLSGSGVANRPILNAQPDDNAISKKIAMIIMIVCGLWVL